MQPPQHAGSLPPPFGRHGGPPGPYTEDRTRNRFERTLVSDQKYERGSMTEHRVRLSTTSRPCKVGILRVGVPALLLASLSTFPAIGQGPTPTFSIDDITVAEGNSGLTPATFTVTRANPNANESRVLFVALNGTAVA